eukprot:14191070-Alexandrium_andersonii.AAC.1
MMRSAAKLRQALRIDFLRQVFEHWSYFPYLPPSQAASALQETCKNIACLHWQLDVTKKQLDRALKNDRAAYLEGLVTSMPHDFTSGNMRQFFAKAKRLVPYKPKFCPIMPTEDPAQLTAAQQWDAHFSAKLAGKPTTFDQLWHTHQQLYTLPDAPLQVECVPTLTEVWEACASRSANKAHGYDLLPGAVWREAAAPLAALIHPLFTKCAMLCYEPLMWHGSA